MAELETIEMQNDNFKNDQKVTKLFTSKERLEHFNRAYEVNLNFKDKVIDLSNCKRYVSTHSSQYLNKDLSRIFFNSCEILILPKLSTKISELKPKMIKLKELYIPSSNIHTLNLSTDQLQTLEILHLPCNKISTIDDIKIINSLPRLRLLYLTNNPIVTDKKYYKEYKKLKELCKQKNIRLIK